MKRDLTRRRMVEMGMLAGGALSSRQLALSAPASPAAGGSSPAMPGPFRGRVVEVKHEGSIISGKYQAEPVKQMMERGMLGLTSASNWADAWRLFVQKGERIGIKLNPVGMPHVVGAPEIVHRIIEGLNAAGIPNKDIVLYDRYRDQFYKAGFHRWGLPGVRLSYASPAYDEIQQNIDGYNPNVYVDLPLTRPEFDISNERARRSYASNFITREVDKVINYCLLKDHQSAGITMALKNLSHGMVNNVSRSHSTTTLNTCGFFIPAIVSAPFIRNKVVLHILDGIKGLYHGGPGSRPQFVWEHKTVYFATDPVALDHVGWRALDAKRVAVGMKPVAEDRPDKFSTFLSRQPEHVELAGALGLGEWEWGKIDVRRVTL